MPHPRIYIHLEAIYIFMSMHLYQFEIFSETIYNKCDIGKRTWVLCFNILGYKSSFTQIFL